MVVVFIKNKYPGIPRFVDTTITISSRHVDFLNKVDLNKIDLTKLIDLLID